MPLPNDSLSKLEQILPILEHIDSTVDHLRPSLKDPLLEIGDDLRSWYQDVHARRDRLSPEQFDREMQVGMTLAVEVLELLARTIEATMRLAKLNR